MDNLAAIFGVVRKRLGVNIRARCENSVSAKSLLCGSKDGVVFLKA